MDDELNMCVQPPQQEEEVNNEELTARNNNNNDGEIADDDSFGVMNAKGPVGAAETNNM